MINELTKLGFTVSQGGRTGQLSVGMQATPSEECLSRLLALITPEYEIFYWDYYSPTRSDPGAYITIRKNAQDELFRKKANHGWSGDWKQAEPGEVISDIIRNWDKDCDRGKFLNRIEIRRG